MGYSYHNEDEVREASHLALHRDLVRGGIQQQGGMDRSGK
jgi:hypothetical protein